jgi:hypothetical protein
VGRVQELADLVLRLLLCGVDVGECDVQIDGLLRGPYLRALRILQGTPHHRHRLLGVAGLQQALRQEEFGTGGLPGPVRLLVEARCLGEVLGRARGVAQCRGKAAP